MNRKILAAAAAVLAVCAAALGGAAAQAASAPSPVHHAAFFGCFPQNGAGSATAVAGHPLACPAGSILAEGDRGTQGPAGPAGAKGDTGQQGPSGVVSLTTQTLAAAPLTVTTGGSFTAHEQLAGTLDLKPGTYLVTLAAKAAWKSGSGVFPQFFVYNGTPAADFSNDVANIGSGALPDGNASIDSYYGGTFQVTVAAGETVSVYAFGYDADRGAGSYTLESLTATETQLTPAS